MADHIKGELPRLVRLLLHPAGAPPLGLFLGRAIRRLARRRPGLFERLGPHRTARFLIEPTDLAFSFLVIPDGEGTSVRIARTGRPPAYDVAVRGPLLMLMGLLDGTYDGDALFFNRIISVTGRTEALLALRNTLEDAELTPSDLLGLRGNAANLVDIALFRAVGVARGLTGADPAAEGEAAR